MKTKCLNLTMSVEGHLLLKALYAHEVADLLIDLNNGTIDYREVWAGLFDKPSNHIFTLLSIEDMGFIGQLNTTTIIVVDGIKRYETNKIKSFGCVYTYFTNNGYATALHELAETGTVLLLNTN